MATEKPLPQVNPDTQPFWDGCKEHELRFQKCMDCGHVRWPPSMICPECHAAQTEWITAGGKGAVYTYAVYHRAFHPVLNQLNASLQRWAMRKYKKFPKLFDSHIYLARIADPNKAADGVIISFAFTL